MDKIWVKNYPAGVAPEIDIDKYSSLPHFFNDIFGKFAARTAFVSMDKHMSFAELDVKSQYLGGWLQSLGLKRGARVAIMMPNLLQYPLAIAGILRAGYVVVNCNPLYTPRELLHQLNDAEADAVIVVENFAHTLQEVIANTKVKHVIVTSIGEALGGIKGFVTNLAVRHIKKMVPQWKIDGAINLNSALAAGAKHGFTPINDLTHDDIAFLQYTGGTTGVSKGAMLTHKNILANVLQAHEWVKPLSIDGENFGLTALPLYHIFALTANCMLNMILGSPNLLIANPRDIDGLVKDWAKYPITSMTGVNTLFNALLHDEKFAKLDFSTLRIALGGGMAVQSVVAEKWKKTTGVTLIQAYGLTETSPAATINPLTLAEFNGSIGLPISSTEIAIRNDAGEDMPLGQSGEICVRGPQVMKGYWQRPKETADVMFNDGFLRTGDIGFMDKDGYIYLVDRKKDTIIVSGFNVYPNEVEEAVSQIPGVLMVAAVGIPSEHSGEAVKVFVVKSDPNLTEKDIISHCRELLTGYKVPRQVEFRDDLPKSDVGKVLRRALK